MTSLAESYTYCENLARREAANFYPAFRLLPRPQRLAMCALYAFLRVTDDLGDGPGTAAEKRGPLAAWRRQMDQALRGQYSQPLHAAFHHTVETFGIPRDYLEAVLDGVEMDLQPVAFATFGDLYGYCYRVASAVGLACIHIWGFEDGEARKYAESAGIGFQLTNILRDLGEDVGRGRIYLPQEDLDRFGYTAEQLHRQQRDGGFRELMRFQVQRARGYYEAGLPLTRLLTPPGRAVFLVMWRTYRGLLDVMEQRDYDVFTRRVRLSLGHKLWLAVQALPVRWGWV
jgi:phytoene synthase